ncbi:hypothetical protein NDU88_011093 [Pleurodeles waltl]|uniref:Uncharacterized protein n=1 Tax=Pleurodeles waltl TaxID=8319 RepID=A0AAV7PWR4_PLEWA|nr:hypothetical protein NDU88_011093 [Pleurodeles waltl]
MVRDEARDDVQRHSTYIPAIKDRRPSWKFRTPYEPGIWTITGDKLLHIYTGLATTNEACEPMTSAVPTPMLVITTGAEPMLAITTGASEPMASAVPAPMLAITTGASEPMTSAVPAPMLAITTGANEPMTSVVPAPMLAINHH